jgi:hypothetical protein
MKLPVLPTAHVAFRISATIATILLAWGAWHSSWQWVYVGCGTLIFAFFPAAVVRRVMWLWLLLGELLGWVNSRILLSILYFGFITPLGWFYRRRNRWHVFQAELSSYYTRREHTFTAEELRKPW